MLKQTEFLLGGSKLIYYVHKHEKEESIHMYIKFYIY